MILKIKTVDNAWVYYSVKRKVKVRELTDEQYRNGIDSHVPDRMEVIENSKDLPKHMQNMIGKINKTLVINFEDQERCDGESIIYTNLTVYLLNDEGKTIERLN